MLTRGHLIGQIVDDLAGIAAHALHIHIEVDYAGDAVEWLELNSATMSGVCHTGST